MSKKAGSIISSGEHMDYLRNLKREKYIIAAAQILIIVTFFALWEITAVNKIIDPFLFSSPSRIINALFLLMKNGSLFVHIGVTLAETLTGFILGLIIGISASIFLWWNSFFEKVLSPYLVVLNSLPKTALAPILIVWLGNNIKSVIATALMTSVIVTILSVLTGFQEVDPDKIKLIKTLGGNKRQTLQKVVMPASLPSILNAVKISIGLSFVGVIVGEFLVAQSGLGYLIVYGSQIFKMDWVMLSIIILCVLAWLLYKVTLKIENKFLKWQ